MTALAEHFSALDYELADETWVEIMVGGEWIDARTQFRSTTVHSFPGGHHRLDVEARIADAPDWLENAWVEMFWDGPWRVRRGYEILLAQTTGTKPQ